MEIFAFLLARIYYTLYCAERHVHNLFRPMNQKAMSLFEQIVNVCKNNGKELIDDEKIKLEITNRMRVQDESFLNPVYGMISIHVGSFVPLIPCFYSFAFFSAIYYLFFSDIIDEHTISMILIVISYLFGYIYTNLVLPDKKWMFYFVKFEIQQSNRIVWHFCSLFFVIMSFVCFGLGANLFYILKMKGS